MMTRGNPTTNKGIMLKANEKRFDWFARFPFQGIVASKQHSEN